MSRKVLYGKGQFGGSVLDKCVVQMSTRHQDELRVMLEQKAAELEERRQVKLQRKAERKAERDGDRALTKARRLAWERKYGD